MRYYLRPDVLIIRGKFRAISSGAAGGMGNVRTLMNITVPPKFSEDAAKYIERISARHGFLSPEFGLLTTLPVTNTCIAQYDEITVFATAAVSDRNRTVNLITVSAVPMTDAALIGALITVTEAKTKVLADRKIGLAAQSTDAAIIAAEQGPQTPLEFAGPLTETGAKIHQAVTFALTEALIRFDNYLLTNWGVSHGWAQPAYRQKTARPRPSFFIYSRYGGEHWNEWLPEGCPYHPCHGFDEQICTFCYCPIYPCKDTGFSEEITTHHGKKIWSCQNCRFIHEPAVEQHLRRNPEAEIAELKGALTHVSRS